MRNKNTDAQSNFFSDDHEENMRIENEILHLKLKAELGGELVGIKPLPPDLENTFLKNILELEHAFANTRQVKMYDFLGKPLFKRSNEMDDEEIATSLQYLCSLLEGKNIIIDFLDEHDARLRYNFITEEIFEQDTDDVQIPGVITHYIYEEYHPNHHSDIESRAIEFIEGWLDRQIDEYSWELANTFHLPDGKKLPKTEILERINAVFAFYAEFRDPSYTIEKIHFELKEHGETGLGYAVGRVSYKAILQNGEGTIIDGPFKICLSMEYKWWSVFYFVFPGFHW